jgi:DNA-binding transcriptional MerR regulator
MLQTVFGIGEVAKRLGVKTWQVRRLEERGLLDRTARIGWNRIYDSEDLPKIEAALRKAGYLGGKRGG